MKRALSLGFILVATIALVCGPPGCTMGPEMSATDANFTTKNDGKNTVRSTFFDEDGKPVTWSAATTGATSEIQQDSTGVTGNYTGAIPNSGTIFLPGRPLLDKDGKPYLDKKGNPIMSATESVSFVAASNMDMSIGKLTRPDGTVIENFQWSVKTSETIRALNEALDRFKEIWPKLSEEQRKALEAAVNQIAPGLFEVLKMLAGGLVAVKDTPMDVQTAQRLRDTVRNASL